MKLSIELPDYSPETGIDVIWDANSKIRIVCDGGEAVISANREGLLSLGQQLIYLANPDITPGCHVHLDDFFCGEALTGCELIIEKI